MAARHGEDLNCTLECASKRVCKKKRESERETIGASKSRERCFDGARNRNFSVCRQSGDRMWRKIAEDLAVGATDVATYTGLRWTAYTITCDVRQKPVN